MVPRRRRWKADERGQALVETALVLPAILLIVVGVVMAGRIVHAKIAVQAAAREVSRSLATAPSEQEGLANAIQAGESVAQGYDLDINRLTVDASSNGFARGGTALAEVSYGVSLADLPLLSQAEIVVSSSHAERIDLYRSREVSR